MARTPYIEIRKGVERNQKVCRVWVLELICGRRGEAGIEGTGKLSDGRYARKHRCECGRLGGARGRGWGVRVSAVRDEQANRHNIWPGSVRFA